MSVCATFIELTNEQLFEIVQRPKKLRSFLYPKSGEKRRAVAEVFIDRAWQGIHFLLTGRETGGDGPESWVIEGGEPIGVPDESSARFLTSKEVAQVGAVLASISRDDLAKRFDAKALEAGKINPGGLADPEALEFALEQYVEVQKFYRAAAERGNSVLIDIG